MAESLTKLPLIQYYGMDYNNVIDEIQDIISNHPLWNEKWTSFYNSEAGNMLTQLTAFICDNLGVKADSLINELFVSTAERDGDILRLLRLIGYVPKYASSATIYPTLELSTLSSSNIILVEGKKSSEALSTRISNILRISGKDIYGKTCYYEMLHLSKENKPEYLADVILQGGTNSVLYNNDFEGNQLTLLQGETKYVEFSSNTDDGPYFDIYDTGIASNSIRVYNISNTTEHFQVNSFVQKEALSNDYGIPYVVSLNENGSTRITYGNNDILTSSSRRYTPGSTIGVFYRVTNGIEGNIQPGFINTTFKVHNINGETVKGTIYNESQGVGGANAETMKKAALNGPLSIKTMERAVTPDDYNIILKNYANGYILKTKSYTSSNQPDDFKSVYGRYINPQEVFSYVMLNKDYENVPASQYNNYPWIFLKKENIFNEQYVFDTAEYNKEVKFTTSTLFNKLEVSFANKKALMYRNAGIIRLPDMLKNSIISGYDDNGAVIYNENVRIKLSKLASENEKYFSRILMSLLYDLDYDPNIIQQDSIDAVLTTTNNSLALDTYAKFISPTSFQKNVPIDCFTFDKIKFYLDDKSMITIDIKEQMPNDYSFGNYYLLLDNVPDPNTTSFTPTGTTGDAFYRKGIVQLINEQLALLISGDSDYAMYNSLRSYQFFGINFNSKEDIFQKIVLSTGETLSSIMEINGVNYRFQFSETILGNAKNFFEITDANYRVNNMLGVSLMISYQLKCTTENNPLRSYNSISGDFDIVCNGIDGVECSCQQVNISSTDMNEVDENNNYIFKFDILIYSTNQNGMISNKNIIDIDFNAVGGYQSLIHILRNKDFEDINDFMPDVKAAANYNNIASVREVTYVSDNDITYYLQYLNIQSPLFGEQSSIYFYKDPEEATNNNFMSAIMGVNYKNSYSDKAYGRKSITLVLEDSLQCTYDDGYTLALGVKTGDIIYENNSINTSVDFDKIYASYKVNSSDSVILGSVYENFYVTGDSEKDKAFKPNTTGLLGQAIVKDTYNGITTYDIDEDNSEYIIKFTNDIQETTSIYSITSDLDVIACGKVRLNTADILDIPNNVCDLLFTFDELNSYEDCFVVDLSSCNNSTDVYNEIYNTMVSTDKTNLKKYSESAGSIIEKSFESRNSLVFSGLTKKDSSAIRFLKPEVSDENYVKNLYKALFGTNISNNVLYTLYPKSLFDESNIVYEGDSYYYIPTTDFPLTFKYRELSNGVSRGPDYYINTVSTTDTEGNKKYNFILNKTADSQFQDFPFYVHFVNDRTYEVDKTGTFKVIEEDILQEYIKDYTISGMDVTFIRPYIKTFDICAEISYSRNFSLTEVSSSVNTIIENNYKITKQEIGQKISKSKIFKDIMSCSGVTGVKIKYFGYDYGSGDRANYDELTAKFFEILCIHEDSYSGDVLNHGKIFTFLPDD